MQRSILILGTIVFALALAAPAAHAEPTSYDVTMTTGGGFSASWIHEADSGRMVRDGIEFWGGGTLLYSLEGTIFGTRDLATQVITWTGGTINAVSRGVADTILSGLIPGGFDTTLDLTITVLGGTYGNPDFDANADGVLNTRFDQGAKSLLVDFYFHDATFAGQANTVTPDLLTATAWGNNTLTPPPGGIGAPSSDIDKRIGIDLRLEGSLIPEPSLLALGLAGAIVVLRRRRSYLAA